MSGKARSFVFTVNNFTTTHVRKLLEIPEDEIGYLIVGQEIGEESKIPHLQGYINWKNPRSIKGMVNILPGHIEVAKGSPFDNYKYCSKEGNVLIEVGVRPKGKPGKRTDIDYVRSLVQDGANANEIWEKAPSFQAFRMGIEGIKLRNNELREPPTVYWFWGPTGTGKTRKAFEMFPNAWVSGKSGKWWEGYYGQPDVIIDDFRPDWCHFVELLRILDRYPYRVEVKGSSTQLLAKNIVITCPFSPATMYCGREDVAQLLRRISVIEEFGTDRNGTEVGGNSNPLPFSAQF